VIARLHYLLVFALIFVELLPPGGAGWLLLIHDILPSKFDSSVHSLKTVSSLPKI